jgi:hypothetical protein
MDSYGKVTLIESDEPTANRFRTDRERHFTIFPSHKKSQKPQNVDLLNRAFKLLWTLCLLVASRSPCLTMDSYGKVTLIESDEPTANRFRTDRERHLTILPSHKKS